jgi:hypothetical protein
MLCALRGKKEDELVPRFLYSALHTTHPPPLPPPTGEGVELDFGCSPKLSQCFLAFMFRKFLSPVANQLSFALILLLSLSNFKSNF